MSSDQPPPQRRQPRQDDVRVAPYLTHVVAHHGQLTLVPPQNAGRIRKSGKKKRQPSPRERDDDEPRFTTAVPLSSSRKLHQAPAHVRTRKHAISTTAPASPPTSRRYESLPDSAYRLFSARHLAHLFSVLQARPSPTIHLHPSRMRLLSLTSHRCCRPCRTSLSLLFSPLT